MPQAHDEAGNIWETDAQGNPVRLLQAAGSPQQPMTVGTPNPAQPFEVQRAQAQAQTATAQAPYAGTTAAAEARRAAASATEAEAKAAAAQKEQALAPNPQSAKLQQSIQTDNVLESINAARRQIGKGWATGNVAGTGTFQGVPFVGQNSANLAATLSGIEGSVINDTLKQLKAASANGASGFGALSEKEGQRLAASVAALQQTQDADSLKENLARVEKHYRNALALLNNENPYDSAVAAKYGIVQDDRDKAAAGQIGAPPAGGGGAPPPPGLGGPQAGNLTSGGHYAADPTLAGVNATVAGMIRSGRSAGEIRSYLDSVRPGMGSQVQHLDQSIAYANQHPNIAPDIDVEQVWQQPSGISQALGDIGMSPAGSALIGAADTLSAGTLDNMTANPAATRATMDGLSQINPDSYAGGQIGGGVATGLGLEAGLARVGLTAPIVGDALSGALYSAGSQDDPSKSRVAAALLGAGESVVGGRLGRGASRVAGRAAAGVTDEARALLNDAGVRMTPGQILGGATQRVEDRLSGLPLVGDMINARRREGVQDFNRAAFDQALGPIRATTNGVIGEEGVDVARQLRSDAYDAALGPVQVAADAPFISDMQGVVQAGRALPEPMRSGMDYTLPTRVGEAFDANGGLTGRDYQQVLRGLRRDASAVANQPYGYDFGQVTRQAEDALSGMLDRQAPGVVEALAAANRANTGVETIRSAVDAARNGARSHQPGVFMPSQLVDSASRTAKRFGNSQGTTNQPFFELGRAGQEVLPSQIPDSGTAGRMVIPLAVGVLSGGGAAATSDGSGAERAGTGAGVATVAALLAAAPYSASARNTVQRLLMAERPDALARTGQVLLDNSGVAGRIAAPGAVLYLGQ